MRMTSPRLLVPALLIAAAVGPRGAVAQESAADGVLPEQKSAMKDMRDVAVAIEEYSIDHNVYPGPTLGMVKISTFQTTLVPIYMKSLPLEDDWGHAFRYWSNGTQYLIMSAGEDGREDLSYDAAVQMTPKVLMKRACRGPMSEASSDIVFADGAFCTYPEAAADAEESAPEE